LAIGDWRLAIGRFVVAERFIMMKRSAHKPSPSGKHLPLQQIPLEQLKHVVGGVTPARNPVTLPAGHPPT
jgi:hypothetical protein